MGHVRALLCLIVVGVVSTLAASARAATPAMCDDDADALVSLPPALLRSDVAPPAEVAGPPAAPPRLLVEAEREPPRELCRAGFGRDTGCYPYKPLPAPGRTAGPLAVESFVLVRPPVVPPPARGAMTYAARAETRLAPGFARRIDRPPRAV